MERINLENKFVKKIEFSPNHIFLVRISYLDQDSHQKGTFHAFYRILKDMRIVIPPRNSKELEEVEKIASQTQEWKEITDHKVLKEFSFYKSPIKKGECSSCEKEKDVVAIPFKKTVKNEPYEITQEERTKGNYFCYICLRKLRSDIGQTNRIERIHVSGSEIKEEKIINHITSYIKIIERIFEEFEVSNYPRTCIFCQKNETETIFASGEEYDYSVSSAKLDAKESICDNCFNSIKQEQGSDKIKIAKFVVEKTGGEWIHEYHCDDCLEITGYINNFRNNYKTIAPNGYKGFEKILLSRMLIEKITDYKYRKGSLCQNGEKYLTDAFKELKNK